MPDSNSEIEKSLRHLRRGHKYDMQIYYIRKLREHLIRSNLILEDVGTSEEEIVKFQKTGYKISALDVLNTLRCGANFPEEELDLLKRIMEAANLTYEDLGITEAALLELSKRID